MGRFFRYCSLLIICSCYQVCMGKPSVISTEVGQKAMSLYENVQKSLQALMSGQFNAENMQVKKDLDQLSNDLNNEIRMEQNEFIEMAQDFFHNAKNIEGKYRLFVEYSKFPHLFENLAIQNFANGCVSRFDGLPRILRNMQEAFTKPDIKEYNLISMIARNSMVCKIYKSKQQLILDLAQVYVDFSMKGLLTILYSYGVKETVENRTYTAEKNEAIELFNENINAAFNGVNEALKISSREVLRCDKP